MTDNPPSAAQFDNDFYRGIYGDVDALIKNGQYPSAFEYYLQVGQFAATKREAFFTGSTGNDIVTGFGDDIDIYGISYKTTIKDDTTAIFTPDSLGVGEIDILAGRADASVEDGFFLSALTGEHIRTGQNGAGSSSKLYVGQGDKDYGLIRNFSSNEDYVSLSGKVSDYKFESVGGNFRISTKEGDLVGIVENTSELKVRRFLNDGTFRLASRPTLQQGFNSDIYLAANSQAQLALSSGGFPSAVDYYTRVGVNTTGYFSGTFDSVTNDQKRLNDTVFGFGSKNIIAGVGLKLASGTGDNVVFDVRTTGKDELDTLVGTDGASNEFLLGYNSQSFYLGGNEKDFATIENFKLNEDSLRLVGKAADYVIQNVNGNTEISINGDLVARITNVAVKDLLLGTADATTGTFKITGIDPTATQFNSDFYLGIYGDVDRLVKSGQFSSALEYYDRVGQFAATKREAFFTGSTGNDIVTGYGDDIDIYGISYKTTIKDDTTVIFTPDSLGVGEIDILAGRADASVEDGFFLSALTGEHIRTGQNGAGSSSKLYVGQGDKDYGLIRNFSSNEDYVSLSGKVSDYKFESVGGNFRISTKEGDLVGIVENTSELKVRRFLNDGTFRLASRPTLQQGFNSDIYLAANSQAQLAFSSGGFSSAVDYYTGVGVNTTGYFSGTFDSVTNDQKRLNDTVFGFGSKNIIAGVGLKLASGTGDNVVFDVRTTGKDELDILVGTDGASNEFLLGYNSQSFYLGSNEKDFATIENFKLSEDSIRLAGKPADYVLRDVDGNTEISIGGDLIAKVTGTDSKYLSLGTPNAAGTFQLIGNLTPTQDFIKSDGLIDVKIQEGQNVRVSLTDSTSDAAFSNTVGFYRVQDSIGTVIDPTDSRSYKPGDTGYALAAIRSSQSANSGVSFAIKGTTTPTVDLAGGYFYAPFLVVNSTIDRVLTSSNSIPEVFFKFGAANSDGISHVKLLDANTIGFEDLKGGGDLDFNDAIFKVNAALIA